MRRRLYFFVISLFILIAIGMHYAGWLLPIEFFFRKLINPTSRAVYNIGVQDGVPLLAKDHEISQLQAENALLKHENNELRNQLNFFSSSSLYSVGSEVKVDVIGKNIEPLGNTLVLDRGASVGIKKGNPVIIGTGVIIGKIARVEEDISIVQLLTDNQSKIAATIVNKDKTIGLVEGGYEISVRMNFIPQNEEVHISDIVVTSGLEKDIPRGLLIGKIESIQKEAHHPFQQAIIAPVIPFDKIRIVSVIVGEEK